MRETPTHKVQIHYHRLTRPVEVYTEGFVSDDGKRLVTFSIVPPDFAERWSERYRQDGLLLAGQAIYSVCKYHFYQECFTILELGDAQEKVLGYYCDLASPLQKQDEYYILTDWILDLWVFPDLHYRLLDWDEFEQASRLGLMAAAQREQALNILGRLQREIAARVFPAKYIV